MDVEESPWADSSQPSQPTTSQDEPSSTATTTPATSQPSGAAAGSTSSSRPSRGPRRLVAQPTRLEAVDDPLGPLGGASAGPLDDDAARPPVPPQKEQMVVRTSMPQQSQQGRRPADPHRIDDDDADVGGRAPRAPPPVEAATPSGVRSSNQPSVSIEQAAKPTFHIEVGDPVKIGDLTSSHIVYSVRTRTTSKGYKQPEFEVKRRYRDFLWLYNTLHGNNPGFVVPPPPEKQAVGRFDSNFVEARRSALEKMLNKTAAHATLQHDPDLKLFLESEAFNVDVKHKDRGKDPLLASESKGGILSSIGLGSSGTSGGKFIEHDDWFHDRRIYLDALETQLRALQKSTDTVVTQRKALADSCGDFSASLHALAGVELSPSLSGPLDALGDLQLRIQELYQRQAMQDILTLGIVIDEYLRLIGSVEEAFGQRQRAFHAWHSAEQKLAALKGNEDKLKRSGRSQVERMQQVEVEVKEQERKVNASRVLFEDMGRLMRGELERFEREKVEDFKSGVETFLEGAVEAQKELIELWETYLLQLDSDEDGPPLMPAGLHAESPPAQPPPGEEGGARASVEAEGRASEDTPSLSGTTAIAGEESVRASEETSA